jgi:hypothetical protein
MGKECGDGPREDRLAVLSAVRMTGPKNKENEKMTSEGNDVYFTGAFNVATSSTKLFAESARSTISFWLKSCPASVSRSC